MGAAAGSGRVAEPGLRHDGLKFSGKGGKPADICLPIPVMRAVRVVVDGRTTGLLLRNRAGNALTTLDARHLVDRIAMIADCRHITPHGLRRTFCTAGLVSGVPMRDMQIAMRHADPRTTGLYDLARDNKDRRASHRVASFLASP